MDCPIYSQYEIDSMTDNLFRSFTTINIHVNLYEITRLPLRLSRGLLETVYAYPSGCGLDGLLVDFSGGGVRYYITVHDQILYNSCIYKISQEFTLAYIYNYYKNG